MSNKVINLQVSDSTNPYEEMEQSFLIRLPEDIITDLVVNELKIHARMTIDNIRTDSKELGAAPKPSSAGAMDNDAVVLWHLNCVIEYFGGEKELGM